MFRMFKTGDKVRCMKATNNIICTNEVVEITGFSDDNYAYFNGYGDIEFDLKYYDIVLENYETKQKGSTSLPLTRVLFNTSPKN